MFARLTRSRWWPSRRWRWLSVLLIASGALLYGLREVGLSRRAIGEIERLGGVARAEYNITLTFLGSGIQFAAGSTDTVVLQGSQVGDDELRVLEDLHLLRSLTLTNTQVSDRGLARLSLLKNLQYLSIGTVDYRKLMGPAGARLDTPPMTGGRGLEALEDLPKLQQIQLIGPKATDDDLRGLGRIKSLIYLDLLETSVTDAGVSELKKALPNCKVVRR